MVQPKFTILSALAASFMMLTSAYADCLAGTCQEGPGKMAYSDGGVYEGNFKEGYRDGQGTYVWPNKTKYVGTWERGDQNGQGIFYDAEGKESFNGTWNHGQQIAMVKDAKGQMIATGCVSGNCQEGYGTYVYADGDKYEGGFKGGTRSGMGTFSWGSGIKYVGAWEAGNQNGQGTQYNPDGSVSYSGQWQNGKQVAANANGASAESKAQIASNVCVSGDCQNGIGKMSFPGLGTYEGAFKNGIREGQGTFVWDSGQKYTGAWSADNITGHGLITYADGRKFEGSFKDGTRMIGVFSWNDGSKYTGSFKDDRLGGLGVMQNADGSWYVGSYENDQRNGQGTQYKPDGSVDFAGTWKNDNKAS
ncbi:MAG: hypothetical protein J0M12_04710 [Deltaproteobacteria bacterium]|nr:hypothetical protein [Deltaproteobacteria bacterium]